MKDRTKRLAARAALGALVGSVTLAAGWASVLVPSGSAAAAPSGVAGCGPSNVPSGFRLDAAHSGRITPAQYSASGDIQASLIFDQYHQGFRSVYTDLPASTTSTTAATSTTGQNLVIECVAMQFSSAENANRFLQSFEYLRKQAGSIAQKIALPGHVHGASAGYREEQQAFSGYGIASTTVVEAAAQHGKEFFDVSVAGPTPSVTTAFGLLKRIESRA
jgi:hypothetical protein